MLCGTNNISKIFPTFILNVRKISGYIVNPTELCYEFEQCYVLDEYWSKSDYI